MAKEVTEEEKLKKFEAEIKNKKDALTFWKYLPKKVFIFLTVLIVILVLIWIISLLGKNG